MNQKILKKDNIVCSYCKNHLGCIIDDILSCDIFKKNTRAFLKDKQGKTKIQKIFEELDNYKELSGIRSAIKYNRKSITKIRGSVASNTDRIESLESALYEILT